MTGRRRRLAIHRQHHLDFLHLGLSRLERIFTADPIFSIFDEASNVQPRWVDEGFGGHRTMTAMSKSGMMKN
jgi:hypothetical protein